MKGVIAIIRPNKMNKTKEVLAELGFPAMTACKVMGRGKQKGIVGEVSFEVDPKLLEEQENAMKYVPKRMIMLVVNDNDVPLVTEVIMRVNRTGEHGDGKIFVCPIEDSIRVRTGEKGEEGLN